MNRTKRKTRRLRRAQRAEDQRAARRPGEQSTDSETRLGFVRVRRGRARVHRARARRVQAGNREVPHRGSQGEAAAQVPVRSRAAAGRDPEILAEPAERAGGPGKRRWRRGES